MATGKAKYDPLEAAKLGTDQPATPAPTPFETPKVPPPAPAVVMTVENKPRPKFRLLKDKRCSIRGMFCDFKAGRVFDSAGYDIDNLINQGCELEQVKE